jgi:hypothetical protein
MADQLIGAMNSCSGTGVNWLGHDGRAPARAEAGRNSKSLGKRGGLMRMLGRQHTGEATGLCMCVMSCHYRVIN